MRTTLMLIAALALQPGCDFLKPKISQQKLEEALKDWLEDHEIEADGIHCPGDQPADVGHTFECRCEVKGKEIPVSVNVTDDKGSVEWKPKYLTLKNDAVVEELANGQLLKGHDVKIECADPVWVSIPESEWTCDVTDNSDGKKYVATIKFNDGEGKHDMKLDPK